MASHIDSWPMIIKSRDEIPEIFKENLLPYLLENFLDINQVPYIIYAPSDRVGRRISNLKLLCLLDNAIIMLEKLNDKVRTIRYYFNDIVYIEEGQMLLYSWIRIKGISENALISSIVEFNTVVEKIFQPIIEKLRRTINNIEIKQSKEELIEFQFLKKLNYKFMNYGSDSIMDGENIVDIVYQEDIYTKFLKFFKKSISPAHLSILTDKELIIIKDDDGGFAKYGAIWIYIPKNNILDVALKKCEKNSNLIFEINLIQNEKVNMIYSLSNILKINSFTTMFKKSSDECFLEVDKLE